MDLGIDFDSITQEWLHLELDTFENLPHRGDRVARWLEDARTRLLWPLLAGHQDSGPLHRGERVPQIQLSVISPAGMVFKSSWSEGAWARLLDRVREGSIRSAHVSLNLLDRSGRIGPEGALANLTADWVGVEYPRNAHRLMCSVQRGALGRDIDPAVQAVGVDLLQRGAREFHAGFGWITVDRAMAAYEAYVGRLDVNEGLRELNDWLRTYSWGMVLGPGLLARLGGRTAVLRAAPVLVAADISTPDADLVYLQLSHSLDDVSPDALQRLRDFLAPVLPAHSGHRYIGPSLRLAESG